MAFELIKEHLASIGASEDEIYALTHPRTTEFQDTILELLMGNCDPASIHLRQERMEGMAESLANYWKDMRGMSLAIERLAPGIATLGPAACQWFCVNLIHGVDPCKLEQVYQTLSLDGAIVLLCHKRKLPDGVDNGFLLAAISQTVAEVATAGLEHILHDSVRVRINAVAQMFNLCNETDVLRATFKGVYQYQNKDLILFEIANSEAFLCHHNARGILSCPHVYGIDPFEIGGDSTFNAEEYIFSSGILVRSAIGHDPLSRIIMGYFCKI